LQIDVTVRHGTISDDQKAYAAKKAERLVKYYDKLQAIRVILDGTAAGFRCEMIVALEHMHELVAHIEGPDLGAAIDATVDRLERQITEHKDRTRNHKGRGPNPHQPTRT
jgi:putative sigma-54 modulation protein